MRPDDSSATIRPISARKTAEDSRKRDAPAAELQRTAHHEAAHAVADLVFGHRPQLVSIRPTDRYSGVCQSDRTIDRDGFRPDLSVPQQPANVRANVESEVIAALAGPIAGAMFWPRSAAYRGTEPDEQVAQNAVLALGPRYRELLSDLETNDEPLSSDEDKAVGLASAFAGPSQEAAYYGWLRSATVEFVTNYAKPIHDVAEALLHRTVLSGEEVASIVKGTR